MVKIKTIREVNKVYEFWYNDCVYECASISMSLHRTKRGAEMAMEFHKKQKQKEWDELYENEDDKEFYNCFNNMFAWGVRECEILE